MALSGSDPVGNVDTLYIISRDQYNQEIQTNISKGLKVNPEATYENTDTVARSLNWLSRNSYEDTIAVTKISLNEVLA